MNKSITALRELLKTYYALAMTPENLSKYELHRSVNDLNSKRPVVMINELPWNEMNFNGELTLTCEEPEFRAMEDYLRKQIFQYKYFRCDMILKPYIAVQKVIKQGSTGIAIEEDVLAQDHDNHIVSHEYHDILATDEDINKIHLPTIEYDEKATLERYQYMGNLFGDIIPIRITGLDYFNTGTWDDISRYRGVTPLLMDLIDRPEHTHKMVRALTDVAVHRLNKFEELGLFDSDPQIMHCTPIMNSTLKPELDGKVTRKNIWGRGYAQILASVSGAMRDEFDIQYMKETIGTCGYSYYGCCEPLDKMIDIVEQLPNLRKISITPWADVDVAAEAIGSKYVLSSKPNPASVAVPELNDQGVKDELARILDAGKRNNCHMDIVLKDISSTHHNAQNIIRWSEIAMDMVNNY